MAEVWVKVEGVNPGGSIKDRPARAMVLDAEARGVLPPGGTIVEPTSGNTGIGLAQVASARGYRLILCLPSSMSLERKVTLTAYGAELVLTDPELRMIAAIEEAERIRDRTGAFFSQPVCQPRQPEDPLRDHRTGALGRPRRPARCLRLRLGHRRYGHRGRALPERATRRRTRGRGRAGSKRGALRRGAGSAQVPGHGPWLCPGQPRSHRRR